MQQQFAVSLTVCIIGANSKPAGAVNGQDERAAPAVDSPVCPCWWVIKGRQQGVLHNSIEELTPTLLRELVEKIVIYEAEPLDGKRHGKFRRQNIDIYYSFVGKVDLPE